MTSSLMPDDRVYNGKIYQGCTWEWSAQYCDDAEVGQSLAGYTAKMTIRKDVDSDAIISLTSSPAAGIVITEATGLISVTLTAAQTATIQALKVVYDLIITRTSDGYKEYIVGGEHEIVRMVSR